MLFAILFVFVAIYYRVKCVLALSNEFNESVIFALSHRKFTKIYLLKSKDSLGANKFHKLCMKCIKVSAIGFAAAIILAVMQEGL
jgi:hypothetical protein